MATFTSVCPHKNPPKRMRKQGIFLTLALLCLIAAMALPLVYFEPQGMGIGRIMNCCFVADDSQPLSIAPVPLLAILALICPLTLWAIFARKRLQANPQARVADRKKQSRLCLWCVALLVLWYGVGVGVVFAIKDADTVHLQLGSVLPLIAIILILMARHAIKADERLVRSADRLR